MYLIFIRERTFTQSKQRRIRIFAVEEFLSLENSWMSLYFFPLFFCKVPTTKNFLFYKLFAAIPFWLGFGTYVIFHRWITLLKERRKKTVKNCFPKKCVFVDIFLFAQRNFLTSMDGTFCYFFFVVKIFHKIFRKINKMKSVFL